ncbi:MAG: S-layer homology domain-containing protein, partial [Oscillospiraceae bacterium]|nr:S-layer homology domain-containing protein [Oscillospiraceae bacterium]
MKKLLAMVLALVMTLSLCTVTNAFADDKDINEDYAEAVDTLNGMGVFKGYEDGSFKPNGNITRAEVAAIIYRLYTGDVKDKQAGLYAGYGSFSDMAGATWAAGYVGYCANAGFVKGYGNGKFGPSDPVTGYQALAMILRAVGYGKNGEFEGADWELHVAQ